MANVKPNPRATYKAQLLDYDALLMASDDECSYCLSEREIQMLLAFVDYIAWKTRYITTETEIDIELIRQWGANLARKLMSGCCGDNQTHRFSSEGVYQSSDDGGITWNNDPENDPRNGYVGAPPLSGDASSAKRCAAADNVRDLFEQYRDNLIEIVGATPTILAIIAGILAFIGVIAGISGVGVGIGVIFLTMAAEIVQIGGTGISADITFTALETFKCLVYCRMNDDGELTYDAWQGLLGDIANEFDGFAETFFYQTVNGMGYIGMTNAGTIGAATATDCDDCDCTGCQINITFDSVDDTPYTIIDGTIAAGHFAADDLNGEPISGDIYQLALDITADPDCTYTTFSIDVWATNSRPIHDVGLGWTMYDVDDVELFSAGGSSVSGIAVGTPYVFTSSIPSVTGCTRIHVYLNWGGFSTYGGSADIDNIHAE